MDAECVVSRSSFMEIFKKCSVRRQHFCWPVYQTRKNKKMKKKRMRIKKRRMRRKKIRMKRGKKKIRMRRRRKK